MSSWEIGVEAGTYEEQFVITRHNGVIRALSTPVVIQFEGLRGQGNRDNATVSINANNIKLYVFCFIIIPCSLSLSRYFHFLIFLKINAFNYY